MSPPADIVLTEKEKYVLMAIKSLFAFDWGFVNGITFILSSRFATMMTGNLLLLAIEAKERTADEMLFTLSLIAAYVAAGAIYDVLHLTMDNKDRVFRITMAGVLTMGVLADVLLYALKSCSIDDNGDYENCEGRHLYFMTPLAFLSGLIANGYCGAHPDGVTSAMMTGHMRTCPNSLIKLHLGRHDGDETERRILSERARLSAVMISAFFAGSLAGTFASDLINTRYSRGHPFTPTFTVFGVSVVVLCACHHKLWGRFTGRREDRNTWIPRRSEISVGRESIASRASFANRDYLDFLDLIASPDPAH